MYALPGNGEVYLEDDCNSHFYKERVKQKIIGMLNCLQNSFSRDFNGRCFHNASFNLLYLRLYKFIGEG